MDLLPSNEQEEIASAVRSFLTRTQAVPDREGMARYATEPLDRARWAQMAELGWFGLGLSEEFGGTGYGIAEEVMMFRELGRGATAGPFLSTCLGARVAAAGGAEDLVASILAGSSTVALAVPRTPTDLADGRLTADLMLYDGDGAEVVLVLLASGAALFGIDAIADRASIGSIDTRVPVDRAAIDATPIAFVAREVDPIGRRALILAAAFAVGMAEETRDLASAYAKERVQFGKPIGVNQAVKHRCADTAVRAEASFAQVCFAALVFDLDGTDAQLQADAAFVGAIDAAHRNAADNIQVHGGMGFTWEHPSHRYVERAHVLDRMMGGVRSVLDDLIAQHGPDL